MAKSVQKHMQVIHDLISKALDNPKSDANTKPAAFAARMVRECKKRGIEAKSRRITPKQYSLDIYRDGGSIVEVDLFYNTDPDFLAYARQWDEDLKPWLRFS